VPRCAGMGRVGDRGAGQGVERGLQRGAAPGLLIRRVVERPANDQQREVGPVWRAGQGAIPLSAAQGQAGVGRIRAGALGCRAVGQRVGVRVVAHQQDTDRLLPWQAAGQHRAPDPGLGLHLAPHVIERGVRHPLGAQPAGGESPRQRIGRAQIAQRLAGRRVVVNELEGVAAGAGQVGDAARRADGAQRSLRGQEGQVAGIRLPFEGGHAGYEGHQIGSPAPDTL